MSLRLEVVCDMCGIPSCMGRENVVQRPRSARERAEDDGWYRSAEGRDVCPICTVVLQRMAKGRQYSEAG